MTVLEELEKARDIVFNQYFECDIDFAKKYLLDVVKEINILIDYFKLEGGKND